MATITDPQINDWYDAECRVLAETLESMLIQIRSVKTRYNAEISAKLAAWADADLLDERASEGIPIPAKTAIIAFESNIEALLAAVDGTPGREEVLTFPSVRAPK